MMRSFRTLLLIALIALGLIPLSADAGQDRLEITAPPSAARSRGLFRSEDMRTSSRPRESDFRPDNVRVQHDPAFLAPLSTRRDSAARVGLSAWTAPPGRGDLLMGRENSGWLGVGLSVAW